MVHWKELGRRKTFVELSRRNYRKPISVNMNRIDVASTLGIGVFILIGYVTGYVSGPSVIVSMVIASVVGLFTGFYYAELGNRIQKTGSSYMYSYVCIGEWAAFLTGWHLILEYIIGIAAISKAIGYHIDSLLNELMRLELTRLFPMDWSVMSEYFDFFGFTVPIIFGFAVLIGLRRSEFVSKVLLLITISVMLFIIIAGAFKGNAENWNVPQSNQDEYFSEPFFPFGVCGVFRGAGILIFAFIGLDFVHKSKNQTSTFFGFIWYLLASTVLTGAGIIMSLLFPYYLLDEYAPFPQSFNEVGWFTAQWIISLGGILALLASFLGLIFPLQRTLCSMAEDGLIFEIFGNKPGKATLPTGGIVASMLISSLFSGLFTLGQLIDFLSIGTLFSFLMVSISILLLRFANNCNGNDSVSTVDVAETGHYNTDNDGKHKTSSIKRWAALFNCGKEKNATKLSFLIVRILLFVYCLTSLVIALIVKFAINEIEQGEIWSISVTTILIVLNLFWIILIALQPMKKKGMYFSVPFVPFLPSISIFVDIFLLVWLSPYAWTRFAIWSILGGIMYGICIRRYRIPVNFQNEVLKKNNGLKGFTNIGFIGEPEMMERRRSDEPETPTYEDSDPNEKSVQIIEEGPKMADDSTLTNSLKKDELKAKVEAEHRPIIKTPSPSTSLDDIVLCSEIEGSLTERKEPNGKTYFIDEGKTDESKQKSAEDIEQNSVIAFLDDVLNKEENVDEKSIEEFDRALKGSPVVAVIHLPLSPDIDDDGAVKTVSQETLDNELPRSIILELKVDIPTPDYNQDSFPNNFDTSAPTSDEKSSVSSVGADSFEYIPKSETSDTEYGDGTSNPVEARSALENESKEYTDSSKASLEPLKMLQNKSEDENENKNETSGEKLEEILSNSLKVKKVEQESQDIISTVDKPIENVPMSFKDRLTMLLGQQTPLEISRKSYRKLNDTENNDSTSMPRLSHAKSEPDIMKFVLNDIASNPDDNNEIQRVKIPRAQLHRSELDNSTIPPAPKFDPDVYRTLGSKVNHIRKGPVRPVLSTAMSIDVVQGRLKKQSTDILKPIEIESLEIDNEDLDHKSRMNLIKNKLEDIFKKGPQNRFSKPPSVPPSPMPDIEPTTETEGSVAEPDEEQIFNFKEASKPFDTVHKQKILFDDVLKSISLETRPSLRATSPNPFSTNSTVF